MQKFVIKKITRSTNITISEEQSLLQCSDQVQKLKQKQQLHLDDSNLENQISSVRMCGYLKKKRNNSLLMSYNSKEEYEEKLKSFKDVICLIPGNTVLLPSLEPRFTIASNLNTFYTFRCDDNKTCSKWITAILECLSRDINMEFTGKKTSTSEKNFHSQQCLANRSKHKKIHSWENLQGSRVKNGVDTNWLVKQNGKILLELNVLNNNRAKLPIASHTAQILKNCTDNDVIRTTKKINCVNKDENQNYIHHNGNSQHHEIKLAHDTHHHHHQSEKPDQFRLHNDRRIQSREVNRISKMFPSTSAKFSSTESESQRPENLTQSNGTVDEIGTKGVKKLVSLWTSFMKEPSNKIDEKTEEQEQTMSLGEEYSLYTTGDYASVDSTRFNNKLNIEDIYSEIGESIPKGNHYVINDNVYAIPENANIKWVKTNEKDDLPVYSVVNLHKKYEARLKKANSIEPNDDDSQVNELLDNLEIYEDIEVIQNKNCCNSKEKVNDESNIYELIETPLDPSSPKTTSFVLKNFLNANVFKFFKKIKDNPSSESSKSSSWKESDGLKKQPKSSSLRNFTKLFHFGSIEKISKKRSSISEIPVTCVKNDSKKS